MKVCVSGTFNVLHRGHKILIDKAFEIAGENGTVLIGITKGEMIQIKKYRIPYSDRVNALRKYLYSKGYNKRVSIKAIYDKYGPAVHDEYDAIIVSPETIGTAQIINKLRINNRKKPLQIIEIPYVLAEDNQPISSTRILNNEIDDEGRVIL